MKELSLKLILSLTLLLLPLAVSAAVNIDGIYYNLNSDVKTAEVTYRRNFSYSGDLVIPSLVNYGGVDYSVTSITNAFSNCTELTSIKIPSSVTSISAGLFQGCTNLASIIVDEENTVFDSRDNCNAVIRTASNILISGCKSTTIPNGITTIGQKAFLNCSGLTSITIPNSVTTTPVFNVSFYN